MRILQINKYFYNGGGADRVFFDTINGLRERGNEVSEFSMHSPKNLPSDYAKYFVSPIPEKLTGASPSLGTSWKIFQRLFRSPEVEQKLAALVAFAKPEVAHVHNAYHHLSASTFLTLKKLHIPIVLTLHDVFPLCPNHSLLYQERLAEDLFKNKFYNCSRYKCIDNKFLPSLAGTLEAYYYRLRKIWNNVDAFVCPSQFMKNKMVEYGFPANKMHVLPNPFDVGAHGRAPLPLGNKITYLGRIHYEKGIKMFMEAVKELADQPVVVAGSGPDDAWVNNFIAQHKLSNVERHGWVSGEKWKQIMAEAKVVVVPSVFLENCSLTILEAVSHGRIVVATDRGGNSEHVIDGVTGFLAKPEDPKDLARVIKKAMAVPAVEAEKMVAAGRTLLARDHNPEKYFGNLVELYRKVI